MTKKVKHAPVDVEIEREGNLFMFRPMTDKARRWIAANVEIEDWQWFGGGMYFVVDNTHASGLAQAMLEAGLVVR